VSVCWRVCGYVSKVLMDEVVGSRCRRRRVSQKSTKNRSELKQAAAPYNAPFVVKLGLSKVILSS
jgi:hypothetical protein